MEKKSCDEKVCKKCGWCCTNLGKDIGLNDEEKEKLRRLIFEKSGVIYLRNPIKFFLAMSKQEKEAMEKHASEINISIDIKPNKLIYDKKNKQVIIFDFYLNNTECPFYKDNQCLIYEERPAACKKFPKIDNSQAEAVRMFVKKNNISFENLTYEEALKKCREFLEK